MNTHSATPEVLTRTQAKADARAEVAKTVGREIIESQLDPATWAAALSEGGGNRQKALSHYARIRMESLTRQLETSIDKTDSLERRRLKQCLDGGKAKPGTARSVREMLDTPRRGRSLNFLKPSLSPLWLAILWVGSTGMIATCGRLMAAHLTGVVASHLVMISAVCGLAVVGGALVLRKTLPKPWILEGWNTGLVAICHLVCLGSLFLGTKVIKQSMNAGLPACPTVQVVDIPAQSASPSFVTSHESATEAPLDRRLVSTGNTRVPKMTND